MNLNIFQLRVSNSKWNFLFFDFELVTRSVKTKELFNAIKNNKLKFDDVLKKQNELLNKISDVKIGKKTREQKEVIHNLNKF